MRLTWRCSLRVRTHLVSRKVLVCFYFMADIDYAYKSSILKTDLCKRINAIDRQTYQNAIEGIVRDSVLDDKYFDLLLSYSYKDIREARKINTANYKRVQRLRERVTNMLTLGHCVFVTLNFNDETLNNTSAETRKKYVVRYLKQFNCKYVANIDFGSDKEYIDRKGNKRKGTSREHYHALVQIERINRGLWSQGFCYPEHVHIKDSTDIKLSKYISKLSNHAIKETTKRCCLIYSR